MAQRLATKSDRLGNIATEQHQIDAYVLPDAVGDDESSSDRAAEDVQAAGGAWMSSKEKLGLVAALWPTTTK